MPSFAELKKSRAGRQHVRANTTASIGDHDRPSIDPLTAETHEAGSPESGTSTAIAGPSRIAIPQSGTSAQPAKDALEPYPDAALYELPSTLAVRRSSGKGRGVYATTNLKAGQAVLRLKPTVAVLSPSELSIRCSSCALSLPELAISGQDVKALKRCTLCKVVHYCSVKCQRADWTAHKPECGAHRALRAVFVRSSPGSNPDEDRRWVMSESIRALGRICWLRKAGRANGTDMQEWKAIEAMESHTKRLPESEMLVLGKQVQHLRHYLSIGAASGQSEPVPADMAQFGFTSSAELLNLVSAFTVNSHTLSSPSLSPIGVATSPTAALFNHSCAPNCAVVFPRGGEQLEVVTVGPIAQGEELLMSYVDVSLPRHERRADLKKRYGFDCDCALCTASEVDPRWCAKHVGCSKKGKGKIPDLGAGHAKGSTQCDACGAEYTVNVPRLQELIERGKRLLHDDEKGILDPAHALTVLATLIPSLLDIVPPSSYPLMALLRLRALVVTPPRTSQSLQECIASYALAYAGAEATHPPGHPTLAVILAEWGKTLSMELPSGNEGVSKQDILRRLMEAVVVLRKAYTACERGFGLGGGIVGKEVEGLIRGCEGEIGLMRYAQ